MKTDEIQQTTLIRDIDCERMLLGSLLTNSKAIASVREHLTSECFYAPRHQEIYEAITRIDSSGEAVNFVTVSASLAKAGAAAGMDDIIDLQQAAVFSDLVTLALRLKELDIRRRMWELGQYLVKSGSTEAEDVDDIQEESRKKLTEMFASTTVQIHTLHEAYGDLLKQMVRNRQSSSQIFGTPTGFREIDRRGGLVPTDLIVVAGETSNGKTAFATALAVAAIKAQHPIAFYSMEMSNIQLAARIAAMQSGVGSLALLQSALTDDKLEAVDRAMTALPSDLCYFDDDATSSFDKIAASIRTLVLRKGIKGAVVDYLQILNVNMKSVNKEQAMGDVSRRLKNLAKELGIWIIALSQLNRDNANPRPSLNRLRDSGQIGEAADSIMLIWRPSAKSGSTQRYPEPYTHISTQGTAFIDVAKGRNTGIYSFICGFNAETTCFYDIDPLRLPRRDSEPESTNFDPDDPF